MPRKKASKKRSKKPPRSGHKKLGRSGLPLKITRMAIRGELTVQEMKQHKMYVPNVTCCLCPTSADLIPDRLGPLREWGLPLGWTQAKYHALDVIVCPQHEGGAAAEVERHFALSAAHTTSSVPPRSECSPKVEPIGGDDATTTTIAGDPSNTIDNPGAGVPLPGADRGRVSNGA